jgi:thiamine monophosphate synthase
MCHTSMGWVMLARAAVEHGTRAVQQRGKSSHHDQDENDVLQQLRHLHRRTEVKVLRP